MGTAASTPASRRGSFKKPPSIPEVSTVPKSTRVFDDDDDDDYMNRDASAPFADLPTYRDGSIVSGTTAMFATGHKEMKQHLATLTLQIDRLDFLPDDWTSSQAEEVTLRLEAMLTQERCVVSRMEEMLDAARDAAAYQREKNGDATDAESSSYGPTPPLQRQIRRDSWRGADGTPRYLENDSSSDMASNSTSTYTSPSRLRREF